MDESTALLGLLLLLFGIALIIVEIFLPTVGVIGVLGIVAVVVSAFVIHSASVPGIEILLPIVAGLAVIGGLMVVGTALLAHRSLKEPVVTGVRGMIGARVEAIDSFSETGLVQYGAEIWKARTRTPVRAGQTLRIIKVDGLELWVEPT
jgi:membrane-bound serine protease (ClpP class)